MKLVKTPKIKTQCFIENIAVGIVLEISVGQINLTIKCHINI